MIHLTTAALVLVGGAMFGLLVFVRCVYWRHEGCLLQEPGHIGPPANILRRFVTRLLGKLFAFLFVGPIKVIGLHNAHSGRRFITALNHQTERDAIVAPCLFMGARPVRYFIAGNRARGGYGPIVAFTGGIVVVFDEKGGTSAALHTAVDALVREQESSFIIFPQGTLVKNNKLIRSEFYPGTAVLGRKVVERGGAPFDFLPAAIHYIRDPNRATRFHRLMNWIGLKKFRSFFGEVVYGAVIVIGEPIAVETAPSDVDQLMDIIFQRICELSRQAEAAAAV